MKLRVSRPTWSACRRRTKAAGSTNRRTAGWKLKSERRSRSSAAGVARPRRSRIRSPLFHFPQHLRAKRQNEREAKVALHTADRDPDQITIAIQHAAAGNARMAI